MVTATQIKGGLGDYIQMVMMPRMDSKRKFLLGTMYLLAAEKIDAVISAVANMPAAKLLGIVDADGNIDLDAVHRAAKAQIVQQGKLTLAIPLMGDFAFDANDIDELYRYIMNGGKPA